MSKHFPDLGRMPGPMPQMPPQHHRGGFSLSPKAFLVAIIVVILLAVATQFTFEDLGGGPKGAYQRAPGVNFAKNEAAARQWRRSPSPTHNRVW